ncbi:MAG: hypothetical protein K2N63_13940 [Lachnospiraceae bacterium]|nr:hypothetical protein [Lachnospiraceae bacterium]
MFVWNVCIYPGGKKTSTLNISLIGKSAKGLWNRFLAVVTQKRKPELIEGVKE